MTWFTPAAVTGKGAKLEKVTIANLEDQDREPVEAQYNPKELAIEATIPWQAAKPIGAERADLEFTGGSTRTLSLELFFDGYEQGRSVQGAVDALIALSRVRDPHRLTEEEYLRPPLVAMVWGTPSSDNVPTFRGVIESISTKYTMFLPSGRPVRATCSVKIKEAEKVKRGKSKG